MVTDFYYDMGNCSCVNDVISEITSHKEIMKRVLSKRNKVLNVCVVLDKKTNIFSVYIQVRRLFTLSYFIG
jgi:orotate phosphoribosyltransferase-like protein